ncbi:MAG: vWA domain-containing protein [Flavobacteriaceae bacterium]
MKKVNRHLAIIASALMMTAAAPADSATYDSNQRTMQTPPSGQATKTSDQTVKIALLLDTSNSMDGLINQAKAQLWDIVNQFTHARCGDEGRPRLEIALYQYGNDNLSAQEGYIQQVLGFSRDLDEISEKLFSLSTNGGEEYCGEVIQTSLKQLDWGRNPDNLKMIFIAGNEPFDQGRLSYKGAVLNAKEKDVMVNTIFCGSYEEGIHSHWKDGAMLTGGEYMAIDHNRQLVHISTPYDDIIIKLNGKLNKTYISYGALGAAKQNQQSAQDENAMEMEPSVAVKRAVSKSSSLYANESWDLIDASEKPGFNVAKIDKDQLPEGLKDKSRPEIEAFINEKKSERGKIQAEIQSLNAKREAYLLENQKEATKGELESAMLEAIKKQAAKKDFSWD